MILYNVQYALNNVNITMHLYIGQSHKILDACIFSLYYRIVN